MIREMELPLPSDQAPSQEMHRGAARLFLEVGVFHETETVLEEPEPENEQLVSRGYDNSNRRSLAIGRFEIQDTFHALFVDQLW